MRLQELTGDVLSDNRQELNDEWALCLGKSRILEPAAQPCALSLLPTDNARLDRKRVSRMAAVDDEELDLEPEDEEDDSFVQYEIASYPSDLTLAGIRDLWNAGDIVIPDFQREFVWTIKQASLLIDSFLLGLPVPPVFFYVDKDNKYLVIDGQQRILSVVYFLEGYFGPETAQGRRQVFRLTGLPEQSPYAGLRINELKDSDQRKLRNSVLRAVNIKQLSPNAESTSVFHIFERLNTGGTPLKAQEIRNCVYRGQITGALKELNKDKAWRQLLGKEVPDKHQRDVELILRLCALFENWQSYEKPMKDYLSSFMDRNRKFDSSRLRKFQKAFPKACSALVARLGVKPFHVNGPLNTSVLDSVMTVALEKPERLSKKLPEKFKQLLNNKDYVARIKAQTTDTVTVRERFDLAAKTLVD